MSVISTSLRTGINAATPAAAGDRAQRRRAEGAVRRDSAPPARQARRVPERDAYEAGAAAYAGRPKSAPDLRRFEAGTYDRNRGNNRVKK
jgi:hypothetical protein